jgi:hypothetical protein
MRLSLSVTGALIGAGLLALSAPAAAAPISGGASKSLMAQTLSGADLLVIQVRDRRGRRDYRRDRRRDDGAVAAGVIGGLLLGAVIANEALRSRSVEYCMQRYRSYDPRSGTYLGFDGYRHRCL